jgi:hypothetical protein
MASAAVPSPHPTQPAGAEATIRVRVRQQEPAGEHSLSLPIDVRPSRRVPSRPPRAPSTPFLARRRRSSLRQTPFFYFFLF